MSAYRCLFAKPAYRIRHHSTVELIADMHVGPNGHPDGPYVIVIVEFRWSATMEPVITSVYEAMHMVISTAHAAGTNRR